MFQATAFALIPCAPIGENQIAMFTCYFKVAITNPTSKLLVILFLQILSTAGLFNQEKDANQS